MSKFFIPFRTGDVVKVVKGRRAGQEHIIESFDVRNQEYSTDHGAWYLHSTFELVRPCDKLSLKKLYKALTDEDEE